MLGLRAQEQALVHNRIEEVRLGGERTLLRRKAARDVRQALVGAQRGIGELREIERGDEMVC